MNPIGNQSTGVGTNGFDLEKRREKNEKLDRLGEEADDPQDAAAVFESLVAEEQQYEVQFRTMSWQRCALLLFGEYVCLAILALSWSYSVLGWVGGLLVTLVLGVITWYTSYVQWQFIMKHPECTNICDIGYLLFGGSRIAYELTAIGLLLNNIMLLGFHVLTGSKILNTLSGHSQCTTVFSAIIAIISVIFSIPRTLNNVALMSIASAFCMFIALLLVCIYSGIQDHPYFGYGGYYPALGAEVVTSAGAPGSPTFVNALNAVLNITFLWIGQILYPSFIAEMREPRDFPKSLAALTIGQFALFTTAAVIGYYFNGQYSTAPLVGSLEKAWMRKSSFAFVIVPTIIIGTIYANVAGKYLYHRVHGKNSRHVHSNSVIGWGSWIAIQIIIWAIAFVLGEVIPSMGDFLSILSAAFDSFFGFIFWAIAYYLLNKGRLFSGAKNTLLTIANIGIFIIGLIMLGPGLYTSIEAIILDYGGPVKSAFSCADNSL